MFVSPITFVPVIPTAPVKRVERSTAEDVPFEAVEALASGDRKAPKRRRPLLARSRSAAERTTPEVLSALATLKLGG
ncbi:MAG TPA: hypothetical protein VH414_21940 [Lichenihabitans sp.]|jgi:hypothetical protein|nr:hypothetical protein [Lichenihabitans sp.]